MKRKFITILILLSLLGCSKDKLTKPTRKGANTFSCKIDGVVFKPSESAGLFGSPPITVYNSKFDGFTLSAKFYETDNGQIPKQVQLRLDYLNSIGTYDLGVYPNAIFKHSYAYGPVYRTNHTHIGKVKITRCDTINKIYSGTFYFKALDENTGKVVNVTNGRFDVKGI